MPTPLSIRTNSASRRIRIHDVAERCGLSITTVSQALNLRADQCRVSEETRTLVQRVAREMGYRPSRTARGLAKGRSYTVGILAWTIYPGGIYSELVTVLAQALGKAGYHLMLAYIGDSVDAWGQTLLDEQMDGCIVLNNLPADLRNMLSQLQIPMVMVNVESDLNVPQVLVNDAQGMRQVVEHLVSLGHRKITFHLEPPIPGDPLGDVRHYSIREREQAFRASMATAGLSDSAEVVELSCETYANRLAATAPADRPTAVVVYSHVLALPLMRMLWERGVQVPHDLSLATFNDLEFVANAIPPLTTVAIPNAEMGRQAAALLLEQLESPVERPMRSVGPARRVVLDERLIVRASTIPYHAKPNA